LQIGRHYTGCCVEWSGSDEMPELMNFMVLILIGWLKINGIDLTKLISNHILHG
jgi:hypothetical protein